MTERLDRMKSKQYTSQDIEVVGMSRSGAVGDRRWQMGIVFSLVDQWHYSEGWVPSGCSAMYFSASRAATQPDPVKNES